MKRGFTLLELMVASLLLAMVVTIMSMLFNQSSVAWRTGVTNVSNLNDSRTALGVSHDICDAVLPGFGDKTVAGGNADSRSLTYRTVSLWDAEKDNTLRTASQRAFNKDESINWGKAQSFSIGDAQKAAALSVRPAGNSANAKIGFSVGVRSLGPDGKPDTEDDISTWPEEID